MESSLQEENQPIWDQVDQLESKYKSDQLPKVSIIIPTVNSAITIAQTLDSLLSQNYPNFEVIVVDCSTDRTPEIVKGYRNPHVHLYSLSHTNRYELLNKGIAQAQGAYVNFLFPGNIYIYRDTLKYMLSYALDREQPDLIYCGSLLRDASGESKILFRDLTLKLLKRGQQPTSFQSCWFKIDAVRALGKFNTSFQMRGGLDLLCRFYLKNSYRVASTNRVLTDYDLRAITRRMVMIHFWETLQTVYRHFGSVAALRWLFHQKDVGRFIRLWVHSFKVAFSGK